jgi:putative transposase
MSHTYSQILVHLVFSTKNRAPLLHDNFRDELHAFIGGIVENRDGTLLIAGSVTDHIHLFLAHPRAISPADLVRDIKAVSSKWVKDNDPANRDFAWQTGYGMFSASPSHSAAITKYIAGQPKHHLTETFQDEYRRILHKYGIEYDERYLWD